MDNMKIAFIILAYKNPKQLRWMIEALKNTNHSFYVHIDKQQNDIPFRTELEQMENVQWEWLPRTETYWGSYPCVKAVIEGMKYAKLKDDYDYYIHLSGQDFPVVDATTLQHRLTLNVGQSFLFNFKIEEGLWDNKGKDRLTTLHFFKKRKRYSITSNSKNPLNKILYFIWQKIVINQFDKRHQFYGGEFYFIFHKSALQQLLTNQLKFAWLHKRLQYTLIPEEIYIPTMLMANSSSEIHVVNDTKRYIKWSMVGSSPKTLNESNFEQIAESDNWFARKFDFENDEIFHQKLLKFIRSNSVQL
jgi:hypothetical protein